VEEKTFGQRWLSHPRKKLARTLMPSILQLLLQLVATVCVCVYSGLAALVFSIWSRCTASRDWDGAEVKGRVALYLSIAGIVISTIAVVIVVLFLFTKDT